MAAEIINKNRVAELRRERGLTQEQLEETSGIERSKLSRIETNDRNISGTEAIYLAMALGTTPQDVLGLEVVGAVRYRGGSRALPEKARQTASWFRHFVDDALFVDRTASRYGVE
jgi:transcriptional regulator with XRE-family HTH domain